MAFTDDVQRVISDMIRAGEFGTPSASKRGRNPEWPYVPIVLHASSRNSTGKRSEQILGKAARTREGAILMAARTIAYRAKVLKTRLQDRGCRALREQHGLPRELPQ